MSSRRIGNYQITDYIGSGGFGSVFKAEDVTTPGRIVAIKELHKKHTRNTVIKQRFFQEAVAMARLDHPNLPRLFTFGEDNGSYYLVMEFISGIVLSEELHENGPVEAARAVSILAQVLEALSYAHRNGIIHRDLKPDNIILIDDGSLKIKVLDFGIARMIGGENITLTGQGFGTPAYMSPERLSSSVSDDPRIDIYSAGIILFEMLAGKTPFQSQASDPIVYWTEMSTLHAGSPLPPLGAIDAPQELELVIRRATAKHVEDRYHSADEMLAELKSIGGINVDRVANNATTIVAATTTATPSRIVLTTTPGAADVYVDDCLRGSSDAARGKLLVDGLTPGLHTVRVTKAGYNDYRINVALEADGQTDLQVALPARETVEMSQAENTAAAQLDTVKFQGGDESQTALLVIESLPTGSTLSIGSEAVAVAGEDGRATVRLKPGSHEVKVTAPTGASAKSLVTVSNAEAGSLKSINLPLDPPPVTTRPPAVARSGVPSAGKRIAAVAVVALLLALAAAAYFVLRGPQRGSAQAEPAATAPAATSPGAEQAGAAPSAAQDGGPIRQVETKPLADAKKVAGDSERALADAEKAQLEKRLAEAEKKLKGEKKSATPEQPASVQPTPPALPSSSQPQPSPAAQDACVGIMVTGGPTNRFRVRAIELAESSRAVVNGQTNNRGFWFSCGFKAGNRVRVMVFGMKGVLRATRELTLAPGRNAIQIQVSDQPESAPSTPFVPGGRRPRFQRP